MINRRQMILISDSQNQPILSSKQQINQISQTACLCLCRSNGCFGQPISGVYRHEHVVIGPADQSYRWVALVKEHCTAKVLRESILIPQCGSRNGGLAGCGSRNRLRKSLAVAIMILSSAHPFRALVN